MFVVPIQTYILIYKKIYEHWGVAGTLVVMPNPQVVVVSLVTSTGHVNSHRGYQIQISQFTLKSFGSWWHRPLYGVISGEVH